MLKYAALLFNTIALLIYQFFFAEGITVTQNLPSSAKPDSEFTVELVINKGSVGGFAKLQQDLPEGFTAVQDDNNGASFTFTNQAVKFIWMSLPSDKEFKVKYKIKVAAGISGDKIVAGKFSYVSDNVKQSIDIAPATITIGDKSSQPIAATTTSTPEPTTTPEPVKTVTEPTTTTTTTTTTTQPVATNNTPPVTTEPVKTMEPVTTPVTTTPDPVVTTTTTSNPSSDPTSVVCKRTVPASATESFTVEIAVNKGNVTGFAKLMETLPAGFTATAGDLQGASFSFDAQTQKVKFVWVSMPTQTEFRISYKVAVPSGMSGSQNIDGVFSYIENDETKKYVLPTSAVAIGSGGAVVNNTTNTTSTNTTSDPVNTTNTTTSNTNTNNTATNNTTANTNTTNTATTNNTTASNTTANNTTTSNTSNSLAVTNTIPAPQGNVNYRVQIAALRNAVSASTLGGRYNINSTVNTEMADGLTKYTVGSHSDYKDARDARETIRNKGVVGPFVTAYNSGKRITVQEALMITSQKWYR
ncbi:MAG: SPOR domain-containing protein [Bacteroidetes bacterium]|nr:SPOR domain-containing protein [Bacteroidota bacterium]